MLPLPLPYNFGPDSRPDSHDVAGEPYRPQSTNRFDQEVKTLQPLFRFILWELFGCMHGVNEPSSGFDREHGHGSGVETVEAQSHTVRVGGKGFVELFERDVAHTPDALPPNGPRLDHPVGIRPSGQPLLKASLHGLHPRYT